MFAIAFDLLYHVTKQQHPKGLPQAYADIANTLAGFGFVRIQGSVYIAQSDDLANLTSAMVALKALPWLATCVRDIRAFKVEQWSDFTDFIKS